MSKKNKAFDERGNVLGASPNDKYQEYFFRYRAYLRNLAVTRFKWNGLPDEIDPRFLEYQLQLNGQLVFFKDEIADMYAVMKTIQRGKPDIYGYGEERDAVATAYFETLTKKNSVLMHDNMTDMNTFHYLDMFASSLAEMRISRNINVIATRTPVIIAGNSHSISTRNIANFILNGIPLINVNKDVFNNEDIKAIKTDAPITFNELNSSMRYELAEACVFLGIDAFFSNKKERNISGEVDGNTGEMEMNRKSALMVRERACEQINRMFNLNVSVEFNSDIPLIEKNVSHETLEESEVEE